MSRDRADRLPARCDILIVGAGIVGATAAWILAGRGHDVVLVDKGCVGAP